MARYILTESPTPAAIQGVIKDAIDREAAVRTVVEAAGATLEHYYFSPDTMEIVVILSCDDLAALDAVWLAAASRDVVDLATFRLRRIMTGAELAELARRAQGSTYRPPGG